MSSDKHDSLVVNDYLEIAARFSLLIDKAVSNPYYKSVYDKYNVSDKINVLHGHNRILLKLMDADTNGTSPEQRKAQEIEVLNNAATLQTYCDDIQRLINETDVANAKRNKLNQQRDYALVALAVVVLVIMLFVVK